MNEPHGARMPDLAALRREYGAHELDVASVDPDPLEQLARWMDEAVRVHAHEPNAMVLTTIDADGAPDGRVVLAKGIDRDGVLFFTNRQSVKGVQIGAEPRVSLVFFWAELERQVRISGVARNLDDAACDQYFASRPRESQLGAWASPQSQVVPDRAALEHAFRDVAARFGDGPVPRPPHWGGYHVSPFVMEFWQGRAHRMHDRIRYSRDVADAPWRIERLAP